AGVTEGQTLTGHHELSADVCIIGSGAGGAVTAALMAQAGLQVLVVEEGGYFTQQRFRMREEDCYPHLYQESGQRTSKDLSVAIYQGRAVGGTTVVNWTTCFRTPERILEHWRQHHESTWTAEDLRPHFEAVEQRLGIARWDAVPQNANNDALARGAAALGWTWERTRRNVRACANSGYCGFGCPFDAKQGMLLTTLADAVAGGAELYADTRAERIVVEGDRVVRVEARVLERERTRPTGVSVVVRPRVVALCGGAVNSPALLLRSGITAGPVGRRTMLHPVVGMSGRYDEPVQGWSGAPQSVTVHDFVDRGPDRVGFFLEAAPVHPMLAGVSLPVVGAAQTEAMGQLAYSSSLIAICVDGLVPGDEGGVVTVKSDGRPSVAYPFRPELGEAFASAHEVLAAAHFAAGAREVVSLHPVPVRMTSEADIPRLREAAYGRLAHGVFSAHQMGGCAFGPDPATSVVDLGLRHHRVPNLFVVDGSVLPTGLGVNPSETIYGLAHRAVESVAAAT
ncbi:MAG: GMC family oxidoreductase, partial [Myxococcales bacterium]|nr:GMC family oxidoreductase [Myxococcales bacterium]